MSHPHRDHVELLPDVFDAYQVMEVWDSGRVHDICGYRAFLTAVRDEPGVVYHNALQAFGSRDYPFGPKRCYGEDLIAAVVQLEHSSRIDETPIPLREHGSMRFLHADGASHSSPNDNSLVVRLDLGTTRVLLMGDAEAGGRDLPTTPPSARSIEGVLVTCCASELAAQVLVVGHHGSLTSSRTAFLDAVGASVFIVSSGPAKYGTVTLPDADIVTELGGRGAVFRTDHDDHLCATNGAKIGPDADARPGGCDNIRVVIGGGAEVRAEVFTVADVP